MPTTDVLVIGAGPAGSTIAYFLATAGFSTTVFDREDGPVLKVGESLLPEGVRICREMGLGDALEDGPFQRKYAAEFVLSEDGASDRFVFAEALRAERGASAYQVKRRDFDGLLAGHAERAGAAFRWGCTIREVELAPDSVTAIDAAGERIEARYLVDASGQAHVLARQLGLREPMPELRKIAMFSHFEGVMRRDGERTGDITILWNPDGWFWIIPFRDGTTSVGVVGDPEAIHAAGATDQERFDNLCLRSSSHREFLENRRQLAPLRRHADYSYKCSAKTGERFLLLGDAAGFIDPIFSTGVFLAQAGACLARDAILPALREGRLPDAAARATFETTLDRAVQRYLVLVQQFYDARFMDNVIRARKRQQTRRALTSVLAGDIFDEDNPLIRMGMLDG